MSAMTLFGVRHRDDDVVNVVAARTKLAARMRAAELLGVPYSVLVAEPEEWQAHRSFRCGGVLAEVAWDQRGQQYHVGTTCGGDRRYVTVGRRKGARGPVDAREEMRAAARAGVMHLLDHDDLNEADVVWGREEAGGEPVLHMREEA